LFIGPITSTRVICADESFDSQKSAPVTTTKLCYRKNVPLLVTLWVTNENAYEYRMKASHTELRSCHLGEQKGRLAARLTQIQPYCNFTLKGAQFEQITRLNAPPTACRHSGLDHRSINFERRGNGITS
jgi:hypothetical protein